MTAQGIGFWLGLAGFTPTLAALARCGLLLGATAALAGCGAVREEPFVTPYDALSTPAGLLLFLNTYRTRSCMWIECGESSFKYLGASVEAVMLRQAADGTFSAERLYRIECGEDNISACEHGNLQGQLRRGADGPVLVNALRMVDADTLAFNAIQGPAIDAGLFLCSADSLAGLAPAPPGIAVIKVMPDAALKQVEAVFYTRTNAPDSPAESVGCADLDSLPRPEGASADASMFLADVLVDGAGQLSITYTLKSERDFTARDLAMRAVRGLDGWTARPLDETARGEHPSPLFQPSFFDRSAGPVLLDIWSAPAGRQLNLLIAEKDGSISRPPLVALPD